MAPVMSRDHPASKHRIEQVLGDFEKMTTVGRSQNGLTSTIHVLVDSNGLPVTGKLLSRLKSGSMLLADRG
jgi:hypothetical protein